MRTTDLRAAPRRALVGDRRPCAQPAVVAIRSATRASAPRAAGSAARRRSVSAPAAAQACPHAHQRGDLIVLLHLFLAVDFLLLLALDDADEASSAPPRTRCGVPRGEGGSVPLPQRLHESKMSQRC